MCTVLRFKPTTAVSSVKKFMKSVDETECLECVLIWFGVSTDAEIKKFELYLFEKPVENLEFLKFRKSA